MRTKSSQPGTIVLIIYSNLWNPRASSTTNLAGGKMIIWRLASVSACQVQQSIIKSFERLSFSKILDNQICVTNILGVNLLFF